MWIRTRPSWCGWLLGTTLLLFPLRVGAQTVVGHHTDDVDEVATIGEVARETVGVDEGGKPGKTDFVAIPVPIVNPQIGEGLALVGAVLYPLGREAPPSLTGFMGAYTSNNSWMGGAFQVVHTDDDRWRFTGGVGVMDMKVRFYGIGQDPGEAERYLPIRQQGKFGLVQGLRAVSDHLYLGLKGLWLDMETSLRLSEVLPPDGSVPDPSIDTVIGQMGPVVQLDTRDNQFTPSHGIHLGASAMFAEEWLGSDSRFQKYEMNVNWYTPLSKTLVLAARGTLCDVGSGAPFFVLCSLGTSDRIRGYDGGQYRDTSMVTAQAEARWRFASRFGAVGFLGAGWLGDGFDDLDLSRSLPSYGVGLRYLMSESYRVTVGVDYGRGRNSDAWYFRIGEAF